MQEICIELIANVRRFQTCANSSLANSGDVLPAWTFQSRSAEANFKNQMLNQTCWKSSVCY